jgi:hypothetical protein
MAKEPKRQHFVPITYLKNFAFERKPGEFSVHFKKKDVFQNGGTGCTNVRNLCVEGKIYNLPGLSSEEETIIETFYSDAYEVGWTSVYKKLIDKEISMVTSEDRRLIIGMASSLYFRNRLWNVFLNKVKADIIERGYEMSKQSGSDSFVMFGEEVVVKGRTLEEIKKEHFERDKASIVLTGVRATINLLKRRLDSDGIEVMKITDVDQHFVTSDNAVTVRDPDNEAVIPANPSNYLSLPIDHKHTLLLIPDRPIEDLNMINRSSASYYSTLAWNFGTLQGADKFVIGSAEALKSLSNIVSRINSKATGEIK